MSRKGSRSTELVRTPIWLDCDTGHDDAFAILLAARHPAAKLLGVSTVYGNATLEKTTYNSLAILKAIGRDDISVYPGASRPLTREAAHAPDIHGESGLDGTTYLPEPTVPARTDISAVDAIAHAIAAEPKETAWVVATGTLTNIALLFARRPSLAEHIAGLSIMGGAIGDGFTNAPLGKVKGEGERFGNYTPWAEFNIHCDPEAADALFSNTALAAKTTLIPLDLTHQFLATRQIQYGLLGIDRHTSLEPTMDTVSPLRRLFFEIVSFFANTYAEHFGLTEGPPTHDPLAVAAALFPRLFGCNILGDCDGDQSERFNVKVVTEGAHRSSSKILSDDSQCGRTIATPAAPGEPGVRIPRGLNKSELWTIIEGCLTRAECAIYGDSPELARLQVP